LLRESVRKRFVYQFSLMAKRQPPPEKGKDKARRDRRGTTRGKATGGGSAPRLRKDKQQNRMAKCTASLRRFVQDMEREPEPRPPPDAPHRKAHGRGTVTPRHHHPRPR
jgi:hypothetical protein